MGKSVGRFVFAVALVASAVPLFAQLDRGTLAGVVTDASGARIPNVAVTLRNAETAATYNTRCNDIGQFVHPNLPAGVYGLTFEAAGFRPLSRQNIRLSATDVVRVNVSLEVGPSTEVVRVTAEVPRLRTDTPELSTTISNKDMVDIPFSFGFGRLLENFTYAVMPAVQGNRYTNNINGQVHFSRDSLLDGASLTSNQQGNSVLSGFSMEAIAEMKVMTSGISAEFGRTQGGVYNYIMKSGANELHGSAYGSIRNEALNANTFGNKTRGLRRDLDRKYNWAFSFGAPVYIPKLYNGRNKTLFYAAVEKYVERNLQFGSPNRTAPLPEFYEGDFSRLLGPAVAGQTDALGRQFLRGAIYDPATFSQLSNGRWTGDMFPGNRIPVSRFSRVARNLNAIASKYYLPAVRDPRGQIPLVNNSYAPTNSIPFSDEYFISVKIDQNISATHKLAGSYAADLNKRGRFDAADGVLFNPALHDGGPLSAFIRDRLSSPVARLAWDWTVSPKVLNHMVISFQRQTSGGGASNLDVDGAKELGIQGLSTYGFPRVNWGGGPFVNLGPTGYPANSFSAANSYGLLNTASIFRGKHFFKFGVDLRRNQLNGWGTQGGTFNFNARSTAIPNETIAGTQIGYSFASYLLGIVDSAALTDPTGSGLGARRHYFGAFFQDDVRLTSRFTLNIGIRWEYQPPVFEAHDRLSSWNPAKIDPQSGLPGAYDFAGSCQACTGKRYFGRKSLRNWAPRFGFGYQPGKNWTVRGAYGIFYTPDMFNGRGSPLGKPTNVQAGGTYSLEADPVTPWAGLFNWDAGFPQNRYVPARYDVSWGNANRPGMIDPNYGRSGYSQNWNLNIQRALPSKFVLDVGYVGNKSTGLAVGDLALVNQVPASALATYGRNLTNSVTSAAQAATNGIRYPYSGFRGTVASAVRPYPQVQGSSTVQVYGSPLGFSTYHALQVTANRQFASDVTLYASYVWSKTLANMASLLPGNNGAHPLDYYNLALEKSLASYDMPRVVKITMNAELPFGRGKRFGSRLPALANALVGGWSLTPILQYAKGVPLTFTASRPCAANCWNGAAFRPNVAPGNLTAGIFELKSFDASSTASPRNTVLNKSVFSDVQPMTLGTGAFTYNGARRFGTISEDVSAHKTFRVAEKYRIQFRMDFLNLFNRHSVGAAIDTNVTSPTFGQATGVSGNRQLQAGMRLDF